MGSLFIQIFFLFLMFLLLTIVFSTTRQRKLAFLWDLSLGSCFTLELAHHRHLRFHKIFMKYFLPGYIPGGIFPNQVGSRECGWQDLPFWFKYWTHLSKVSRDAQIPTVPICSVGPGIVCYTQITDEKWRRIFLAKRRKNDHDKLKRSWNKCNAQGKCF